MIKMGLKGKELQDLRLTINALLDAAKKIERAADLFELAIGAAVHGRPEEVEVNKAAVPARNLLKAAAADLKKFGQGLFMLERIEIKEQN